MRFLKAYIRWIDLFTERFGSTVSWLAFLLVLVVVYDVITRYVLSASSVAVQELEWHLFSLLFLLAAAYTYKHNKHVRVDIFYARMNTKQKALVDLAGGIVFLLPFSLIVISSSWLFVSNSFLFQESSPDPGGLPYRFLLKAAIPVSFVFLLLQGTAEIFRSLVILAGQQEIQEEKQP